MRRSTDILVVLVWTILVFGLVAGCDVSPGALATPATPAPVTRATATPYVSPERPSPTPAATATTPTGEPTPKLTVETSTSPDGQWIAESAYSAPVQRKGGEMVYTRLLIRAADGDPAWSVVDQWSNYGLGWTRPAVVRWSADGQSVYYTNFPVPDGCALFVDGWDLHRVDLNSGKDTTILDRSNLVFALSPDERALLVLDRSESPALVWQDLAGERPELRIPLELEPNWQAGAITWSPDSQKAVLAVNTAPCDAANEKGSIVLVDLTARTTKVLVEDDPRLLVPVEWPEQDTIIVRDRDGAQWQLDPETGAVREP
jgi:hypothetical protein